MIIKRADAVLLAVLALALIIIPLTLGDYWVLTFGTVGAITLAVIGLNVAMGWAGLLSLYETAQILTVGVIPAAQRRGLGTELVRLLEAEARHRRATELLLEVRIDNEPAKTLYEKEGFVALGLRKGYYDNGRVDAITMRKELT